MLLEFFGPVGLVVLPGSLENGLLNSFQDSLVESLDLAVQVLSLVVDLQRVLIHQIREPLPVGLLIVPSGERIGCLRFVVKVQSDLDGFVVAPSKLAQYCSGCYPGYIICSKGQICVVLVSQREKKDCGSSGSFKGRYHCQLASLLLLLLFCLLRRSPMPLNGC